MKLRNLVRAWLLAKEERRALWRAAFEFERDRQRYRIREMRDVIESMKNIDLDDWENQWENLPSGRFYVGPKPGNEMAFQVTIELAESELAGLEAAHEYWLKNQRPEES